MAEHFVSKFGTDRKGRAKCLLLYLSEGACRYTDRRMANQALLRGDMCLSLDGVTWKLGGLVLEEQYCG